MTDPSTEPSIDPSYITLREASDRVGRSVRVVRSAVKAGEIVSRRGEAKTAPYFVAVDSLLQRFPPGTAPAATVVLLSEHQRREQELQAKVEELTGKAARAEGIAGVLRERVDAERARTDTERQRADQLAEDLAMARRWERAGWRERRRLRRGKK